MARNKKGLMTEITVLIVVAFFVLVFFALWKYGFNLVTDTLSNIISSTSTTTDILGNPQNYTINISEAAEKTFSYVNSGLNQLELIGYLIIFGYIFSTFIIAYFSREHPIMFVVYFLITVILVIFSIYVSNEYETLLNNDVIGSTLSGYTVGAFIMSNLPLIVAVVGLFGIIIGLVGLMRGGEA